LRSEKAQGQGREGGGSREGGEHHIRFWSKNNQVGRSAFWRCFNR